MDQKIGRSQIGVLKHIVDRLPAIVFEYAIFPDGSGDFTYLSPRCEEILGLERESLLSGVLQMKDFIYEEDWPSLSKAKERCLATLSEFSWQGRITVKDRTTWVEAKATPVRLDNDTIVCSGVINDISDQKDSETRVRAVEREYMNLLEFLPVGIGIHAKGKVLYANRYATAMFGAGERKELIGRDVIDLIHPDYRDMVKARIKKVIGGEPAPQIEEKYLKLDGTVINVLSSALPVTFAGEPAVQNIVLNVTEQKEAQLEIRRAEMLFTQLFNNAPLAIVMLDAKGAVVNVNKGFEEMFGFALEELKGNLLESYIVPSELTDEGNDLNSVISTYNVVRIETERVTKTGQRLSVIIYGVPVRFDDETIGIFGLYADITARKKIEEELTIRNSELDNFVYKVSHDLRAPLSSILGLVNLAKLPNNTDGLDQYLDIVGKKAEQLDHFIGDVLSHSKNLKMEVKIGKIDFNKVIQDTFGELTYLSGAENVEKKISITGGDFYSDSWRIKEVFRNLVSNAIRYRNKNLNGVTVSVRIEVKRESAKIVFADNGMGIDQDKLGSIFEMFYRASDTSEGSGLGLYIVKNAIEKLNGSIDVESTRNYGTTFTITLPNEQNAEA